jgi:hypothetical protein
MARSGLKVDNNKVAQHGFFVLNGIFVGIALNDIWRVLNLPGNAAPLNVAGIPSQFHQDYLFQLLIAAAAGAGEVLGGIDHGLALGMGIFMGSTWANVSEAGNYIGGAAAGASPKIDQHAPTNMTMPAGVATSVLPNTPVIPYGFMQNQPVYAPAMPSTMYPPVLKTSTYNPNASVQLNTPHLGYNLP